jgi:ribosome-associated toxin RatA of RatAB toxin-antitoxin module
MEYTCNTTAINAFLLTLLCSMWQVTARAQETKWDLKKNANGIKVYTSATPGSAIKSIKATLEFDAPLEALIALVKDVESYSTWVYKCSENKLIKRVNDTIQIFRHVTDAPFPLDDRDQVSRMVIHVHEGGAEIQTQVVNGILPEQPGFVRLHRSHASWKFTVGENSKINAVYHLSFDPNGNVPAWLINLFITEGPYESLVKMKSVVHQEKYLEAASTKR